jgi:hypothetical protein
VVLDTFVAKHRGNESIEAEAGVASEQRFGRRQAFARFRQGTFRAVDDLGKV